MIRLQHLGATAALMRQRHTQNSEVQAIHIDTQIEPQPSDRKPKRLNA